MGSALPGRVRRRAASRARRIPRTVDAATGGNFLWSAAATVAKGGASGDIIRVATNTLSLGVIAS